jgi:acyl-coenzyme A synthetase/AMP-(fatty) acid ligase
MPFDILNGYSGDAPVTWYDGRPVNRDAFLKTAAALDRKFGRASHVINLCSGRFAFLSAFAGALAGRRITVLPADATRQTLNTLCSAGDAPVVIVDGSAPQSTAPVIRWTPARSAARPEMTIDDTRPAVIVYTSGSRGTPRPHVKYWGELARRARVVRERLVLEDVDNIVATVPLRHLYGFENALMLPLQSGFAITPGRPLFPADVADSLNARTLLVTTPIHLKALLADRSTRVKARMVLSSTAPLAADVARLAERRFNVVVREIYGSTETGVVATRSPAATNRWRLLPGLSLRQNERGIHLADSIGGREVELNDRIDPLGTDEFLLGGREADIVKIAGKRASLAALNESLCAVDGVTDGAFLPSGRHDEQARTRLAAFVVAPDISRPDILARLRQRMDPVFLPRPLVKVDRLPRNATGKLPEASLRELEERHFRAR